MASKPINKSLYTRVKSQAKKKFKVYPSAYANAWVVRKYKSLGGKYSSSSSTGRKRSSRKRSSKSSSLSKGIAKYHRRKKSKKQSRKH